MEFNTHMFLLILIVGVFVLPFDSLWAQGFGLSVNYGDEDSNISPKSSSGWGSPNISPGQGMMDNPWFKASDFLPNPDEYKAPKKKEVERIRDNVRSPKVIWIETVKKDGKTHRANFKALYVDKKVYIPVIVLPRMFKTKVRWKAAQKRLFIYRGSASLTFSLDHGLQLNFYGDKVDFAARLVYFEKMLYVPAVTIAEFFKYKAYWSSIKKLLNCIKRTTVAPKLKKKWKATLKKHKLDTYAEKIEKKPVSSGTKQLFENIWGTSEEPQKIACAGLRGDWYLRAEDMGVALPSRKPLMKKVWIRYRKTGKVVKATVVDVGPWNIGDPYWLKQGGRPEVETTKYDNWGRKSNLAGIDLSFEVWRRLGVARATAYCGNFSAYVDWWFVD